MGIMSYFTDYYTSATISRVTYSNVAGINTASDPVEVDTPECLYFEGAAAEAYISQRFRDRTSAVVCLESDVDVEENDLIFVGGETYHALKPQNILLADELIVVELEVFA
jgi:hypothetical protein